MWGLDHALIIFSLVFNPVVELYNKADLNDMSMKAEREKGTNLAIS